MAAVARELVAGDLLNSSHPLHGALCSWQAKRHPGDKPIPLTRRQARKFLAQYPNFRNRVAQAA